MSDTCPNCGKPVLPTDAACWYCGFDLPRRPAAKPVAAAQESKRTSRAAGSSTTSATQPGATSPVAYDFRSLAIYGLLTLLVVAGLWLVMRSLGQRPVLVRSAFNIGSDWVTVTDSELRYTLTLPPDWQWLDLSFRDQTAVLERLTTNQPYVNRALRPLGGVAGDVEIAAVAMAGQTIDVTEPGTFVVVGRSEALRETEPQAALDALAAAGVAAVKGEIDRHMPAQPQARFQVLDDERNYQCRHLFVADAESAGYLVAACAPQREFGNRERQLGDILDSFQLLEN